VPATTGKPQLRPAGRQVGEGAPTIRPTNYLFDEPSQLIVFRTAYGSKLQGLLTSAKAAFEIDGIDPEQHTGWSVSGRRIVNPDHVVDPDNRASMRIG
jgi:Pyridoxamine 5'-phosphate oxidase